MHAVEFPFAGLFWLIVFLFVSATFNDVSFRKVVKVLYYTSHAM